MDDEKINMQPKTTSRKNMIVNYETMPSREDIAVVEAMLVPDKEEKKQEVTQEQIDNAIVYSNDVTSIDFMMPEDEREILEKNLNQYEDIKKMKKVLSIAKQNKRISEDIKSLELISKTGDLSNKILDAMTDSKSIEMLLESFKKKAEKGESAKAYKELATAAKIMLDAREEMTKRLNSEKSGKSIKIALKFENNNGDEYDIGAEL